MKSDSAISTFTEQMGLVFEAEGLPRISGKIFAYLVVGDEAFSLAELSEKLQVSRGSISTNTRLLENIGMVERVSRPGDRQSYYSITENPYARLLEGSIQRLRKAHRVVENAESELFAGDESALEKLGELSNFYGRFIEGYESILSKLTEEK